MPTTMDTVLWTRDEWRKARADKSKNGVAVPQGAAKVSIGDALDKFHKANAKGIQPGEVAAKELKKDLVVYLTAVKAKYPQWHKRVEGQLTALDNYLDSVAAVEKSKLAYPAAQKAALNDVKKLNLAYEATGSFDSALTKAAEKSLKALAPHVLMLPYYHNIGKASVAEFRTMTSQLGHVTWNAKVLDKVGRWVTALPM
jgi:hypothetical protein